MEKTRDARAIARSLIWDVGAPIIVYYPLRLLGVSVVLAMTAATGVALARLAFVALRDRRFDGFAALMAVMFGIGLALTLITGDPRVVLAKDSVVTGVVGIVFLGSCVVGRPLMYALARRTLPPERQAVADERLRTDPAYRRHLVTLSAMWGALLLAEAVLRLVLVYALPVDVVYGFSHLMQFAAIGLGVVCSMLYGKRARRRDALAVSTPSTRSTPPAQAAR